MIELSSTVDNLKVSSEEYIKQESIILTEDDFRESLKNTWLPDIDTNTVSLVTNDVKKEFNTFYDTTIYNMDKKEYNINMNTSINDTTSLISCTNCRKQFINAIDLQQHRNKCTERIKNNHLCGICNKVFSTKSRLHNHTRIHTGVKPFTCSVCSKSFADRSAFTKHEKIHFRLKDDKVKCNLCGGLFSDSWGLKKHYLTHSGERPYDCTICHKKFRTSSTLVVHKRIHTGEKPYACTLCDKRFTVKTHLVTHNRTHSGERPYECVTCGRAFSDRSSWRRHSRRHTEIKSTDTSQTNIKSTSINSIQSIVCEEETAAQLEQPIDTTQPIFDNFHRFMLMEQQQHNDKNDEFHYPSIYNSTMNLNVLNTNKNTIFRCP